MNFAPAAPFVFRARWIFLRLLGVVLLAAFISIWVQIDGLLGSHGILPTEPWLDSVRASLGDDAWTRWTEAPTLFWFGASDAALHAACALGTIASLAIVAGIAPRAALIAAWAIYLSICTIGRTFLSFQWDILVL